MQTSLILLLLFCLALAGQGYYFGYVRPPAVLAWLPKSTLLISLFLLIPLLLVALHSQSGAKARLEAVGFKLHPAVGASVGIANGEGALPIWVFQVDAPKAEVAAFYRQPANAVGWTLIDENAVMMLFLRGEEGMSLAYRKGWDGNSLIFTLSRP